jgi:hypothetical protein
VREYERPLSSDAFSKFGEDDHQAHNTEVRSATDRLRRDVVCRFAEELESIAKTLSSPSVWPYTGDSFIQGIIE